MNKTSTDSLNKISLGNQTNELMIYIHGIGGSLSVWYFYYMIQMVKNFFQIAYDLRGHGRSHYPKEGYQLKHHTEDLQSLIQNHYNNKRKYIVSYSYGGNIALNWAKEFAAKDDIVFLIDAPDVPKDRAMIDKLLDDVRVTLSGDFSKTSNFAHMLKETMGEEIKKKSRRIKSYRDRLQLLYDTNFREEVILDNSFTEEDLKNITCKTVLIYASKGDAMKYGFKLFNTIPNSKFYTLEGNHEIITSNNNEIIKIIKKELIYQK